MPRYLLSYQTENPKFDYQEFDRRMKESEQHIEKIKRHMQKVEKPVIEKRLAAKVQKSKAAFNAITNQYLINELRFRK